MRQASWQSDEPPPDWPAAPGAWLRIVVRGTLLAVLTFGCLGLLLLIRLIERPLFGLRRPVTPWITQFVCRSAFRILGMGYRIEGRPISGPGAVVANHSSWLDIFALNASQRIYFVSKDEVRGWAGIGWLARATGTVFIARQRRDAAGQVKVFEDRLGVGHRLLFFPEGTSTDGRRVLAFKPTLFAAFFAPALSETLRVQPVSVVYTAPPAADSRLYGWWGDMEFASHLLATLGARRQGSVLLAFHAPLAVADFADRKALSRACEDAIRATHAARIGPG